MVDSNRALPKDIHLLYTQSILPSENTGHNNPILDWTANLFMASRWQYILLTNSRCLYSIVLPGKVISNEQAFVEMSTKALYEYMALDGCENIFNAHIGRGGPPSGWVSHINNSPCRQAHPSQAEHPTLRHTSYNSTSANGPARSPVSVLPGLYDSN